MRREPSSFLVRWSRSWRLDMPAVTSITVSPASPSRSSLLAAAPHVRDMLATSMTANTPFDHSQDKLSGFARSANLLVSDWSCQVVDSRLAGFPLLSDQCCTWSAVVLCCRQSWLL